VSYRRAGCTCETAAFTYVRPHTRNENFRASPPDNDDDDDDDDDDNDDDGNAVASMNV